MATHGVNEPIVGSVTLGSTVACQSLDIGPTLGILEVRGQVLPPLPTPTHALIALPEVNFNPLVRRCSSTFQAAVQKYTESQIDNVEDLLKIRSHIEVSFSE